MTACSCSLLVARATLMSLETLVTVTPLDCLVGFSHHSPCSSVCFGLSLIVCTWCVNQSVYLMWCCRSSFPACSMENLADATLDPEPSQPPPRHVEHEPEPTADGSHATSATQEPSPIGATERAIDTELEEFASDQVREPATEPATVDVPDGREGAEDSTAHCTTAEGEQRLDLGQIFLEQDLTNFSEDIYEDMPALLPPSKLPDCLDFPSTLPLSIVSAASVPPPLSPGSPSAHPQPTICAVGSPQVCQSPSVSWLEDPSSSPPASESWTPPRPSDPAAPPRLSTFTSGLYSSGCASSLRPSGSVDLLPPAGTASVLCRSGSAVDLRISVSALVARALGSAWALRILGVAKDHRVSVSASGSTTTCSASVGRPPGVVSLSSTMAPPSIGSTVGFHHGCDLGLTWLLLLQPPPVTSLAPPSIITSMDYSVTILDSIFCPPPRSPSSAEAPS
ncbi:Unconventional myosin-IXb [Labeo rohita]|uniref:Unconventional myosin-IXb n=1 Tax=Labeo rohita TaxID=84645 RepID=A0ABQ8L4G2_LABRO|nr:Unconventional myosin-IXb [Labeo rohita]